MVCKRCSAELEKDAVFCIACGEAVASAPAVTDGEKQQKLSALSTEILTWGILSIVFALFGGGMLYGVVAAAFYIPISNKVKQFMALNNGVLNGMASTGKALGKVGMICGIVFPLVSIALIVMFLVFYFAIYFLVLIIALGSTSFYY